MIKKKSKIIMCLVLSLILTGSSMALNFDTNQINSDANEQWKTKKDDNTPKLSDPPEGKYILREDPSEVTASDPEYISTGGDSIEIALMFEGDGRDLQYRFEDDLAPPLDSWVNISGYSNIGSIDHELVYEIIIDFHCLFTHFPVMDPAEDFTFMIHCDNGLSESVILAEDIFFGFHDFMDPIVINETSFNQVFQRIREGGYIESISFWLDVDWTLGSSAVISLDFIDIYYMWAIPPSPPINLIVNQRIQHNYLTWTVPSDDGGANITQYNVYRGTIEGGTKSYIGSSLVNNYNDTAVTTNVRYYYIVRAENFKGESNDSNEANGMPRDVPFLEWRNPDEGERVILHVGEAVFTFRYDWGGIDDVELVINGINFGSVWNMSSIVLAPYNSSIDGSVTAVLNGYIEGVLFISDILNFTFTKLTSDVYELLERDRQYIGQKLYLILHDPNGDNSFTSYKETEIVSMAVGLEIISGVSESLTLGDIVTDPLCGIEAGHTTKLERKTTTEEGYEFRYEITDTTELTSSQDSFNKDYIGPGYGDRYWGESWTLNWELKAYHRTYFNGTDQYEKPSLHYGVIRGGEVFLNDYDAPLYWQIQNPVHNGWQNVQWIDNLTIGGGSPFTNTYEISSTMTSSDSVEIGLEVESYTKIPGLAHTITVNLNTKLYAEQTVTNTYEIGFTINDDESSDTIVQDYGIDLLFGTFIFKTNSFMCETSYPLEYDTFDYIPPIVAFPHIEFDSSQDGIAPCKDDSPIITVDIFDEGGIQSALVFYSVDDGLNWDSVILNEQIANPGTSEGLIPAQDHGTTVLWYIKVWDNGGSYSNRTDPHGNPYQYTVINREPTILITTPNGNEAFENTVRIEWSALDPDGDNLTFTISYNLANTGWRLIETSVIGNFYDWDISNIGFYDTVLVKVSVDDDFAGTAYDESDYVFTIGEPEPVIANPSEINWTLYLTIASISFVGAASTIAIFIRRSRRVKEQ